MAVSRQLAANGNLAAEKLLELHAPPTRITLISHAVTVALKRASFPMDEPLTEGETEKIASIGWAAPRAQHVWCGPERRTQETAKALGLEPAVSIDLGEVNYGTW
jgi:broad specificity phosphatase PhoE